MPHALDTHAGAAFGGLRQELLHAPQLLKFARKSTSHPLATLPSQLPKPVAHVMVQTPPAQPGVPPAAEQRTPQAPQLLTSVNTVLSQPLVGTPSQSRRSLGQLTLEIPQVDTAHTALVPAGGAGQRVPHAPQFVTSPEAVLTSHPLASTPSQSPKPTAQAPPHAPLTQVALPFAKPGHGVHDDPHELTAVSDRHAPLQRWVPAAHTQLPDVLHVPFTGDVHAPDVRGAAEHAALPDVQTTIPAVAHPPLPADVHPPPSDSQAAPHRLMPTGQTVPHTPDEQLWPAGHALPQVPQLAGSLATLTHPAAHRVPPVGHDVPHAPPTQVALPPVGTVHGAHDAPHELTAVSDTQLPPQRCVPAAQPIASAAIASGSAIASTGIP